MIDDNVDPNGYETSYYFEYGKTTQYGSKIPATPEGIGSGTQFIDCWNQIDNLEPGTTYHFRIVLKDAGATTYGPDQELTTAGATIQLRAPTELYPTHAVIDDNVDPNGYETSYYFEYGKTTQYGSKIPATPEGIGSGTQFIDCWNQIDNLEPGTTYHYRIVASNANGTTYGPDQELTTPGATIQLRAPTEISTTHAVIDDNVDPNGYETSYYFEYGKTTQYGSKIPATPEGIGSGSQYIDCWNEITGLEPGTTYHFRVVATTGHAVTYGPDQELATAGATIQMRAPTELYPTHAVIDDNVDPNGYETSYYFEYGKTTQYGSKIPATPEGIGSGTQFIDCWNQIDNLEPGTTYHFRIVMNDAGATSYGPDQELTTPGATIGLRAATELNPTHAVIDDNVNPNGYETSYYFEYGKTTQYGSKIPATPEGIGSGTQFIDCWNQIDNLEPGTTYHYRIVAITGSATTYGPDQELTTPGATITLRAPTELSTTHAVIDDNVNPNGYETSYYFEYGKTSQYGSKIPATPEGIGSGVQAIDVWNEVENLESGTPYHYRVVVKDAGATTYGPDQEFTTPLESYTQTVDSGSSLNAVSCVPNSTDCVVSDSAGKALYSTNVSDSSAASWSTWSGPSGESPSQAVDCPSSSLCVLADGKESAGGKLYYATSLGGSWSEAYGPSYGVDAISCALSPSLLCVDGQDGAGYFRYSTKPASTSWELESQGSAVMKAVLCLSSSFCILADSKGNVHVAASESEIKSSSWNETDVDGSTALNGVACVSTSSCVAVDGAGNVVNLSISSEGVATAGKQDIDGSNDLTAVTCTRGATCVAVDSAGNVLESKNGGETWAKEYSLGDKLTSVSCASSSLCAAVDTTGKVTSFDL